MPDKYPKIRTDLIIQEIIEDDGSKHFVIKDPITNNFFKVGEPEYFIISNFDGQKSNADIIDVFQKKFETDLAEDELSGFIDYLQQLCFLDNELSQKELLKKQKEADTLKPKSLFGRIIFFKIKAFNPGRLFEKLMPYTGIFFSRAFNWIAGILIILSFFLTLYNSDQISNGIQELISLKGLILIYLVGIVVILLHEFAHGLTCTRFGGKVQEIGFLMIYFQPAFYCDVSDAWLFPEKKKRLLVSFSGAYFQLFIYAVSAFVWRLTQTDVAINQIALAAMTFSGISSIINFNPLLRYDGYYLLSDYLGISNLRHKVRTYWINLVSGLTGLGGDKNKSLSEKEKRLFFYYGIFSFLYIVLILGYFFYMVADILVSEFGGSGFLLFALIMILIFRKFIISVMKGIVSVLKRKRPLIITAIIIVVLIVVSLFGKWELRIKGDLVLQPTESLILKYDNLGYAQLIKYNPNIKNPDKQREVSVFTGDYTTTTLMPMVHLGQKVKKGDIIARLANSEVARYLNDYAAQLQEAEEELSILKQGARKEEIDQAKSLVEGYQAQFDLAVQELKRKNGMLEKDLISKKEWETAYTDSSLKSSQLEAARHALDLLLAGNRPELIRAKEADIAGIKSRIETYRLQQEFSEIKSTIDGVVLTIDTGTVVCEIAPLDILDAVIMLSEKELSDIKIGQAAKFKARSYPSENFYGSIYRIDTKVIEDEKGRPSIRVFCKIENIEGLLKPGMTGVANIYCGKRKISYLIYRKFFRTIRTEFWDWFDWF